MKFLLYLAGLAFAVWCICAAVSTPDPAPMTAGHVWADVPQRDGYTAGPTFAPMPRDAVGTVELARP